MAKSYQKQEQPNYSCVFLLETIREYWFGPKLVQTDCGTKKYIMAAIQYKLHNDVSAHRYGSSPFNQHIEKNGGPTISGNL